jgi:hypothetical protein
MAEKYFNRREAEEILPLIEPSLEEARRKKADLENLREDMAQSVGRIMALGGSQPPRGEISRKKAEFEKLSRELVEAVNEIQQTGCLVKDLDAGLIDFPSLRRGEEVYLCWKLGEDRIGFWHGVDEGFAGRKPLDDPGHEEPPHRSSIQ